MRNAGRIRLGYYPLAVKEAQRIRGFLHFPDPAECSAVDPCAGCGTALVEITADSHAARYGIELDAHRAEQAGRALHHVIQGNCFDVHCPVESFSLLYLNPLLATAMAWLWLGEGLGAAVLLGGALVVSGVVLVNRHGRPPRVGRT